MLLEISQLIIVGLYLGEKLLVASLDNASDALYGAHPLLHIVFFIVIYEVLRLH